MRPGVFIVRLAEVGFVLGLISGTGCVEPSPPPHQVINNQRKQTKAVSDLRRQQLKEVDGDQQPEHAETDKVDAEEPQ